MPPRENLPSVSVIIPIYKTAPYLRETLQSLADQTYFKNRLGLMEICLVIDGFCDDYQAQIPSELKPILKVMEIPHKGVSGARNHGIEKASGELIAFLDGDDVWKPEKLERQVELIQKHPQAGAVYCNTYYTDKNGKALHRTQLDQFGRLPSGNIGRDMLERNFISISSMLLRRDVIEAVGHFDTQLEVCEDWDFNIRVATQFEVIAIEDPLNSYRLHEAGCHYKLDSVLDCGYKVVESNWPSLRDQVSREDVNRIKSNVAVAVAGLSLYTDRAKLARTYLKEAQKLNPLNDQIFAIRTLSYMPRWMRNLAVWIVNRRKFSR
jgi:glycosyltransferase involved in cell wall biosynthesis